MTKSGKSVLGFFTILPVALTFACFLLVAFLIKDSIISGNKEGLPIPMIADMVWMLIIILTAGIISFGLLVYYIIHALNNVDIDSNEKIVWIIAFILGNILIFPVYWYMRIWRNHIEMFISAN
ncbi:MAG: hypothetical protein ACO29O_00365 [Chitinophagaceae bacterium]